MTILNIILIGYIFSMTVFDYSFLLGGTEGGVNGSVDVMSLFFYRMAFGDNTPFGGHISSNSIGTVSYTHLDVYKRQDYIWLNPGSVSIPKEGNPPTYAVLENGLFEIKDFDRNVVKSIQL